MPLIDVSLTPGAFDEAGRAELARRLTDAACRAESVPDTPASRLRAIILMAEHAPGHLFMAGAPADGRVRGVFMTWRVSAGVLDGARKAAFAAELQAAAEAAAGAPDGRPVVTSCVIEEVPEGQWAQTGRIRRLPEVAAAAGFTHLGAMAEARS